MEPIIAFSLIIHFFPKTPKYKFVDEYPHSCETTRLAFEGRGAAQPAAPLPLQFTRGGHCPPPPPLIGNILQKFKGMQMKDS